MRVGSGQKRTRRRIDKSVSRFGRTANEAYLFQLLPGSMECNIQYADFAVCREGKQMFLATWGAR